MDRSKRYSLFNVVEYGAKRGASSLPFIPLHGNVKNLSSNLYFGKSELANVDTDNKNLFDLMYGKLLEAPTLFWGYGFHDNAVERTIAKLLHDSHQDIWILCMPGNEKIDYFRELGCHVIEGTTEELLDWIEENCPEEDRENAGGIDLSSLQQYMVPSLNSLDVVKKEDYFTQGCTHWFCILSDYAYQTKYVNLLYNLALKKESNSRWNTIFRKDNNYDADSGKSPVRHQTSPFQYLCGRSATHYQSFKWVSGICLCR